MMDKQNDRHKARLAGVVDGLLQNPDGRYFLRWLVDSNLFYRSQFPAGHAEAAFREGMRAVGAGVFELVLMNKGAGKLFMED